MDNRSPLDYVFGHHSLGKQVKLAVFFLSLGIFFTVFTLYYHNILGGGEIRLILHFFYILLLLVSSLSGSVPGLVLASLCSGLAIYAMVPTDMAFAAVSLAEYEIFTLISIYFIIVIAVDWFRSNHENLKQQIKKNEELYEKTKYMEKLALAGEIAAGIAHEIRNPLTVVQGYIQLFSQNKEDLTPEQQQVYNLILEELHRTNAIIADFLRFSRPDAPNITMISIHSIIESALSLFSGEATRQRIELNFKPDPQCPDLYLDKEQFMQVFLNLFANAIQAMPDGGTLTVNTRFDPKKELVEVFVSDSGKGIPKEMQEKVFTPFFTTRENGTGLGLSITQNIIKAHGGRIELESKEGRGATFMISLPAPPEAKENYNG